MKRVVVPLSTAGIEQLRGEIEDYKRWQRQKAAELMRRLAELGVRTATIRFAATDYIGVRDASVTAEETANGYVVRADGESVLFLEFGAGDRYGHGHPEEREFGMGAGTYPYGKGHWDDPMGWWLPKEKGGWHTYGNAPGRAMYEARKEILRQLPWIAKEVFGGG